MFLLLFKFLFFVGALPFTDGTKFQRGEILHLAFQGIHDFYDSKGHYPRINNLEDSKSVLEYINKRNESVQYLNKSCELNGCALDEFDNELVLNIAIKSNAHFQPLCSFFGGIVAQEIVKITGKEKGL